MYFEVSREKDQANDEEGKKLRIISFTDVSLSLSLLSLPYDRFTSISHRSFLVYWQPPSSFPPTSLFLFLPHAPTIRTREEMFGIDGHIEFPLFRPPLRNLRSLHAFGISPRSFGSSMHDPGYWAHTQDEYFPSHKRKRERGGKKEIWQQD